MDDLGLVSVKGHGGPAAVLFRAKGYMMVAECSGEEDLAVRIIKSTDLGQTHWDRGVPVSERLLGKVAKVSMVVHEKKLRPIVDKFLAMTTEDATLNQIYA